MNLQVQNFPEPLHRKIKIEAASRGMSLREFVIECIENRNTAASKPAGKPSRKTKAVEPDDDFSE